MKKWLLAPPLYAAMVLMILLSSTPATAASITYDAYLGGPGFFNGSGNPDGGFKIVEDNGVTIGLRAKHRQDPDVIHTANDTYQVELGSQSASVTNRAWWNYEWSIDVGPDNTLASVLPFSTLTFEDQTFGVSYTVHLPYWLDNSTYGPDGEHTATYFTDQIMQNSQNPVFGDFPLAFVPGYTFNMDDDRLYKMLIEVRNSQGLLASNYINIRAGNPTDSDMAPVPEPASMVLLGSGLAAAAAYRRRKSPKKQAG